MKQNKKLRQGEELENRSSLVLIFPKIDPEREVLHEQTLVAIYHPGVSCNPPGRVGSGISKTYELLKPGFHKANFNHDNDQF